MPSTKSKIDDLGRECSVCRKYKLWVEYGKRSNGPKGYRSQCKKCFALLQKKYRYGLTPIEYAKMTEESGGACCLCKNQSRLVVDHNHLTGVVRGLICDKCNVVLGLVKDDTATLCKIIEYLKSNAVIIPSEHALHSSCMQEIDLIRRYGISEKDYQNILSRQQHSCALCDNDSSSNGRLAVDHDHSSGAIRGLLCTQCNVAIAMMGDSSKTAQRMIDYLERF